MLCATDMPVIRLWILAVLGDKGEPGADGRLGRIVMLLPAVEHDLPADPAGRIDAEQRLEQFRASRAHQPGHAQDFPTLAGQMRYHASERVLRWRSGARLRCSTRSTSSPAGTVSFGNNSVSVRPTIMRISSPLAWSP